MTEPTFADVKQILRAHSIEAHQYRAFVHGYVHGRQDAAADKRIDGTGDLRSRVDDLFEQYMASLESDGVPGDE